jgi:CBS domain containing-hemolysin-like protein
MAVLVPVLVCTVLILLNGLFVAAEFAIVGAPRATIERLADGGSRSARLVRRILDDPREQDRFIATAQLGITAASLGLGMYGEHLLAEWLAGVFGAWFEASGLERWIAAHAVASVIAIAVLTYFHIVVGEMVPKSLALSRADRTVLWIAPPMRALQYVLYPLVAALNGVGNGLLRLVGIERHGGGHEQVRTPEELAFIVRESQAGGLLRSESASVVQELLEFGDLTAGEVMVPRVRVTGIPLGAGADQLRRTLETRPHTRYPVYDGTLDQIVGMLHVKDMLRCLPGCPPLTISQVRAVPFLPESAGVERVMAAMRQANAQLVVVMDEHGGTAGIITVEDLFEEVVGDIGEDALEEPEIRRVAEGCVRALGTARVEDVGSALGVALEHEDVDSVSGLVLALLGRPPQLGDRVRHEEVELEVTGVYGHGVAAAIVRRLAPLVEGAEEDDTP